VSSEAAPACRAKGVRVGDDLVVEARLERSWVDRSGPPRPRHALFVVKVVVGAPGHVSGVADLADDGVLVYPRSVRDAEGTEVPVERPAAVVVDGDVVAVPSAAGVCVLERLASARGVDVLA